MNTLYLQMDTHTLLNNTPLTRLNCRMIKRTFDITTALIVMILFFPWIYLIIACCIKVWMPGPVFLNKTGLGKMEKFLLVINLELWMHETVLMNL